MNKLMAFLLLGLGLVMLPSRGECAAAARGAKNYSTSTFTTTASSVSVSGAGVVYGVILGTGTAGTDFLSLFDASSIAALTSTSTSFKVRVNVSSATQNTIVSFDPPLQFNSGIVAANSAATLWSTVIYEKGRLPTAY
jgi:hypothetical protein